MKKNTFRILYIIPITNIATLLFFAYRYIWFAIETVPSERIFALVIITCWSCLLFMNETRYY
jgi:hypothetical protein